MTIENYGFIQTPYKLQYPTNDVYPQLRINGDNSGDLIVRVHLSDKPQDKIELTINHGPSRVSFVDLVGNGPGKSNEHRHQQGYGKLLVNLAIQVVRRSEWVTMETPVHGTITDERTAVVAFWRAFGMTASSPGAIGHGRISGKVGDLITVQREYLAGGVFPLSLGLSHFVKCVD